jgi:hypothetical protein
MTAPANPIHRSFELAAARLAMTANAYSGIPISFDSRSIFR